jgi:hypothetical protein
LSIVWQLLVPGTQIVTLVCSRLRVPVSTRVTLIGWTFGVVDCGTTTGVADAGVGATAPGAGGVPDAGAGAVGFEPSAGELSPPPPHPDNAALAKIAAAKSKYRLDRMASAPIRCRWRRRPPAARR